MKVEFPIVMGGKAIRVTEECDGPVQVFEFIAQMQELFGDMTCRRNGEESDNVILRVRENTDGDKFYESVCLDTDGECGRARRSYHLHKKGGGMYLPKKASATKGGHWLPNDGWLVWNKETQEEE